jgi:predicted site-specific integrase-resolvase
MLNIAGGVRETPKKLAPAIRGRELLSKQELALALGVSTRTLTLWMSQKRLPFFRMSSRLIKFDLERVKNALAHYEIREVAQ